MNLPGPAASSSIHLVADWVELATAANRNGLITGGALVDAREEADDRRGSQTTPAKADARNREVEEVWEYLRARAAYYGDDYPFEVSEDVPEIQTATLNPSRLLYAFLLAASSLSAFKHTDRHLLTGGFERASRHALAGLLPPGAKVNIFGTSSADGERYNHGKLVDRLQALASDMATRLTLEAEQKALGDQERISGDGGLDLVGWPALAGPHKRLPVYFGQCACGDDWPRKPFEVMSATWDSRLEPVSPIIPVTFIPYAYRAVDNDWLDMLKVPMTVLVDRPRWLSLLDTAGTRSVAVNDVPTSWLLDELPGLSVIEPQLA